MDSVPDTDSPSKTPVLVKRQGALCQLVLNRPRRLNSLNLEMVRILARALHDAAMDDAVRLVVITGEGNRAFCAGGDVKEIALAVKSGKVDSARRFFVEEYQLDLVIHFFPKPIVVLAHGITMGGGLGLASGADLVVTTPETRIAMPETRIGFFPDVGATGWLHEKCPLGYPEYLALTGYEVDGLESVRLGLASHAMAPEDIPPLLERMKSQAEFLPDDRQEAINAIDATCRSMAMAVPTEKRPVDDWVATFFGHKESLSDLLNDLRSCSLETERCHAVFERLSERSPTAVVMTFLLLKKNSSRPLREVFQRDLAATGFMIQHHDYGEGVRARLLDKDDAPRWQPTRIEEVRVEELTAVVESV